MACASKSMIPWTFLANLDSNKINDKSVPTTLVEPQGGKKSFLQVLKNDYDFSISQLPQSCIKGEAIAIKIPEEEYQTGLLRFASTLGSDSTTLKEAYVSIELVHVEIETESGNHFWKGVESLFLTNIDKTSNSVTQEVQKLFSYKNESGWALLTHGSTVLLAGHGTTMLKTVSEFDKWKKFVNKAEFEISFKEYYTKVFHSTHICTHIEIPMIIGAI
ncbi:unnamed protein product [Lupinus luteus]|uniref:Sieve element occlusion C-terminal domain-containing protein n=1 Tax=Lupinus luteus TaxID=3873 RepID=A0AAV1VS83_LUPLU